MIYCFGYQTKIGKIYISAENNFVVEISFLEPEYEEKETSLIKETYGQLQEYFEGKRKSFNVPIKLNGSEFQKKVWTELLKIPYGSTVSYKDIAKLVRNENASRAVGMANNKNKIMFIIPCHRVIGKNGSLTGYAGGLDIKTQLLELDIKNK